MYLADDFGAICNNIDFYRTVCGMFKLYGGLYVIMIRFF